MDARVTLRVDGELRSLTLDTRVTLLDALRERLGVTSPKKGCDHGQCGACTVLVNGRRVLACLMLAVAVDGAERATGVASAVARVAGRPDAAFLAGGTNLVDHMKLGIASPGLLVDVAGLPLDAIEPLPDGGVRIGALVRNSPGRAVPRSVAITGMPRSWGLRRTASR